VTDTIHLTLEIENTYELYEDETTRKEVDVPVPPGDDDGDAYDEWEYDNIFCHTGSASGTKTKGDSWYDVTVTASSAPGIIPVGTTYEFGY
jgi:hypothetical protein